MAERPYELNILDFTNVDRLKENENGTYTPSNATDEIQAVLDVMLRTLNKNLDAQFKSGRFKQGEYSTAFTTLYASTQQTAMTFFLQKYKAEKEAEVAERQKKAFDDNIIKELTALILDGYNMHLTTTPNVDNQPYPNMFHNFFGSIDGNKGEVVDLIGDPSYAVSVNGIKNRYYRKLKRSTTASDKTMPIVGYNKVTVKEDNGGNVEAYDIKEPIQQRALVDIDNILTSAYNIIKKAKEESYPNK